MESSESESSRVFGPGIYIPFLTRVPLIVTVMLVVTLSDLAIPDSMREALRYSIVDKPYQLVVIALALVLACLTVRFTAEAIIELVSPDLYDHPGLVGLFAHLLPRAFALALAIATGVPLLELALDLRARSSLAAAGMGLLCVSIGIAVAALPKGPHATTFSLRRPDVLMRWVYAILPVLLAIAFAGAVLGAWQEQSGLADHALERYASAIIGTGDGALGKFLHDAPTATVLRYEPYVKGAAAVSTVSPLLVLAELISLFASCVAARLAIAIFLDLVVPSLGSGGSLARTVRAWLPRLGSAGLGIALAIQILHAYLEASPAFQLSRYEILGVWGIAATYAAIGVLASLGSGSAYIADGPWRESRSVGRRFRGAVRRLSSLDPRWQWFIGGLALAGMAVFLLFVNRHYVEIAQWIGPVGIVLLWGFTATALFFPLAYLSHMTRIPTLTILLLAALTFAGFNLNDNHELRVAKDSSEMRASETRQSLVAQPDRRQDIDLAQWIDSRQDRDKYEHYPIFLIATEGGGIRAAYFTASVLAALQERCPAFAQHTLAISGVSGGSLGAAVFAGLAADHASNLPDPGCNLDGVKTAGPIVQRARTVLSADLLSPLLGAMLFPDALQRIVPVPVPRADRARAIEYAVEHAWRNATPRDCKHCDSARMSQNAADLYSSGSASSNAVPNLFLNTTEAGTGRLIPYATLRLINFNAQFRDQAEIDDSKFDGVRPPLKLIEGVSLQDRMADDRVPLSTAAIVSARFPYLTPAASLKDNGHYVDGGYFENSGTYFLAGLIRYLIGEQLSYPADKRFDAARKAVFTVIVIQSEPCTREHTDAQCDEDSITPDDSWNEVLSPLRALLSTRDTRADYSYDSLNAMSALIEQMSPNGARGASAPNSDVGCDYPVCAVTLRFRNHTHTDIPLTWVLSSEARKSMDNAVDGMEQANVRLAPPRTSMTSLDDTQDIDRILGSYRRVLCVLANRTGGTACTPAPPSAAPVP